MNPTSPPRPERCRWEGSDGAADSFARRGVSEARAARRLANVLAVAASLILAGCNPSAPPQAPAPLPPRLVQVAAASVEGWTSAEEVVGTIRPRLRAAMEAKVPGRIESLPVAPGQRVQQGDLLAALDARETRARLDSARATAEQAARDRDRVGGLVRQGASTPSELDAVEARHRVAAAAVAEAESLLGQMRVTAPFDGVVTRKHADVGDLAVPGRALIDIEDPSRLRMEADVPEFLVQGLLLGMKLPVHAGNSVEPIDGVVAEVAPVAEPGSRTHLVKLDLPPVQGLRSGQFGRVSVPAGSAAVLHVPEPALIVRGQLEYVMVQEEGVARLRLVRTGRRQSGRVSVVSGLNAGERVVVAGLDGLRDGQAVEVRP